MEQLAKGLVARCYLGRRRRRHPVVDDPEAFVMASVLVAQVVGHKGMELCLRYADRVEGSFSMKEGRAYAYRLNERGRAMLDSWGRGDVDDVSRVCALGDPHSAEQRTMPINLQSIDDALHRGNLPPEHLDHLTGLREWAVQGENGSGLIVDWYQPQALPSGVHAGRRYARTPFNLQCLPKGLRETVFRDIPVTHLDLVSCFASMLDVASGGEFPTLHERVHQPEQVAARLGRVFPQMREDATRKRCLNAMLGGASFNTSTLDFATGGATAEEVRKRCPWLSQHREELQAAREQVAELDPSLWASDKRDRWSAVNRSAMLYLEEMERDAVDELDDLHRAWDQPIGVLLHDGYLVPGQVSDDQLMTLQKALDDLFGPGVRVARKPVGELGG